MKNFHREYPLFSLCGLNCGLCPMHLGGYCPGCGGGAGNQPCPIARCSMEYGDIEYCYQCKEYPCKKYEGIDAYDSFITHRNQLKDFGRVKKIGLKTYQQELEEKITILKCLLDNYNDGRKKNFFCIVVNLLELEDIKEVIKQISHETSNNLNIKEKSAIATSHIRIMAERRNIDLKLRKKQK